MNDNVLEKIILHKILNSKDYDWSKKFNINGTDLRRLDNVDYYMSCELTRKFASILLHDKKCYNFVCRNGYSILATSLSYNDVLNGLLENENIRDKVFDLDYFKRYLNINEIVRVILKICNDDVRLNKYFMWDELNDL